MKERGKLLRRSYSKDPRGEVKSMLKKGANITMLAPFDFPKPTLILNLFPMPISSKPRHSKDHSRMLDTSNNHT